MSSSSSNLHDSNFETPPPTISYNGPPLFIAFILIILVVFFFGFCVLYFCKFCFVNIIQTWALQRNASGNLVRISTTPSPNRGLDPSQLEHFPTFSYATVKDLRKQDCSLECAICLLEFEEDSLLRLLTICYHVFHQECIDLWLCSHKSCPVCRTELDSPANETKPHDLGGGEVNQSGEEMRESLTEDDEVRIDVKDDGDDERGGGIGIEKFEEQVTMREHFGKQEEDCPMKFARSHSTGHSVVLIRGGDEEGGGKLDKYTLKLPENAQIKIISGEHKCTKSCATSMEMTHCVFLEAYYSPSSETDQKI